MRVQERHLRGHAAAVRVRQRRRRDRARGVERRVLLPHRRADDDAEQRRTGAAGAGASCSASVPTPASTCRSSSTARVPDNALKKEYADLGVISEDEGQDYFTGDNVQLAIGQGLLSAIAAAAGRRLLHSRQRRLRDEARDRHGGLPARCARLPRRPAYADLSQARLAEESEHRRRSGPADPDAARDPRRDRQRSAPGDHRAGHHQRPATTTRPARISSTSYPNERIPIAGKTGTAQGAGNYPWNDSSAFAAFSTDADAPVHGHRLPREGRATAPRPPRRWSSACSCSCPADACTDPVVLSDQLDTSSDLAAQPQAPDRHELLQRPVQPPRTGVE